MFEIFRTATILLSLLTLITGVAYPFAVTLVAQGVFPHAANGSLIARTAHPHEKSDHRNPRDWRSDSVHSSDSMGSELIGQPFSDPKYFWGRPSATAPFADNSMAGSGSNQATTNPALEQAITERIEKLRKADPTNKAPIPVDLVTASASGLDPHISQAAALYQVERVARQRNIDPFSLNKLVLSHVEKPTFGVLGRARVNVLKLNLALDGTSSSSSTDSNTPPPGEAKAQESVETK